ncbi:MAG TPA: hypothetical protein VLM05_03425 [Mycobacteriales bacterium]|nr:hypothetical protein [Mycobacteriales bacterium]
MSDVPSGPSPDSARYEIRVRGHLDAHWADWFDGFSLAHAADGSTVLAGQADQPRLLGALRMLADLGLPLVSVTPAAPEPGVTPGTADPC